MSEASRRFRTGDMVIYVGHSNEYGPCFGKLYVWHDYNHTGHISGTLKPVDGGAARYWTRECDAVHVAEYDDWRLEEAHRQVNAAIEKIGDRLNVLIEFTIAVDL